MPARNVRAEQLKLLDEVPHQAVKHFGRPLREHLVGTRDLLAQWGAPEALCLAGLFHSVYGTKTFQLATLTTQARDQVRKLIGEYAESLVYVFCMSDRKGLLLNAREVPHFWVDHRTGARETLPGDVLDDLVELDVANFLEQLPFGTVNSDAIVLDMRHRFECAEPCMSVQAKNAYHEVLDGQAWRKFVSVQAG